MGWKINEGGEGVSEWARFALQARRRSSYEVSAIHRATFLGRA